MCSGRLRKRCPSVTPIIIANLVGHQFRFHKKITDGSAKADAYATGNKEDVIWGVIFSIEEEEMNDLDCAEGLCKGYNKRPIEVIDTKNKSHRVWIYSADEKAINFVVLHS